MLACPTVPSDQEPSTSVPARCNIVDFPVLAQTVCRTTSGRSLLYLAGTHNPRASSQAVL